MYTTLGSIDHMATRAIFLGLSLLLTQVSRVDTTLVCTPSTCAPAFLHPLETDKGFRL